MFGLSLKEKKVKLAKLEGELSIYRYFVTKTTHPDYERRRFVELSGKVEALKAEIAQKEIKWI